MGIMNCCHNKDIKNSDSPGIIYEISVSLTKLG